MNYEVLTARHGCSLVITMNRPAVRNAIDHALADALLHAMERLDEDEDARVGILTGAGGAFCSGVDLTSVATSGRPSHIRRFLEAGSRKPLIAAVEGAAVAGGLELALTCDLIVAARGARLGIPEARVGQVAAGGALMRLPHGLAMEMALTGELVSGERAYACGLVQRLTDDGAALTVALDLAERIGANAPLSVATSKELVRRAHGLTEPEYWRMQDDHAPAVFASDDAREGPRAFVERRPPRWSGR